MRDAFAAPQTPLRLLMLSHYFAEHRGGVEIVAGALVRALAARGIELCWAATGDGALSANAFVRRIPLSAWNGAERAIGIPYPILFPSAWRQIFAAAARSDAIIVHDSLYLTSVIGFFAARMYGKPIIVIQHIGHVPYRNPILRGLMSVANRIVAGPILAHADQTVFISELTRRHFEKLRWRRPPLLLFNGVDTDIFTPAANATEASRARESFGLPATAPIALFVGRFVEKKGLPLLERVAKANPDITFVCAGWGPLDPSGWGLPNVRVFSSLAGESLGPLYRACDALILPSVGEGFPLVVQEALASGLLIVCGAETAQADIEAAPFLCGVAFETSDPQSAAEALSVALRRALSTPKDAAARAAFAQAHYNRERVAERYAELARVLIARSSKKEPVTSE